MADDTTPIFPHESREGGFPYMSTSTYFPLQHQCWHWSSLHPACWPHSHALSWAWKQTHAVTHRPDWFLSHIGSSLLKALVVDCLGPELARTAWASPRPSLQSWGFRGWSCLPSEWSSSSSWQFSSSLASWSPCPHLKVRAHVRPLCLVTNTVPAVCTAVIYSTDIWWLIICIGLKTSIETWHGNNCLLLAHHDSGVNQWNWVVSHYRDKELAGRSGVRTTCDLSHFPCKNTFIEWKV